MHQNVFMTNMLDHNDELDAFLSVFYAENRTLTTTEYADVEYLFSKHAPVHTIAASLDEE